MQNFISVTVGEKDGHLVFLLNINIFPVDNRLVLRVQANDAADV